MAKKRVGRPAVTGPSAPVVKGRGEARRYKRISIVPSVALLERIAKWRAAQDDDPGETRATMMLVERGLAADKF